MTTAEATPELTLADHADRAFLGHPRGLAYLAFTEAWERFSYYGMQTLLVLYMVKYLLLPENAQKIALFEPFRSLPGYSGLEGQPLASAIFGSYAAYVYVTPIIGGFLADRVLGKRRTVLIGAILMALGHFLMAFDKSFLFALLALILGSGCLKGNLAAQVGSLYKPGDLRRADAFQIYYLGINAGVIISPFIVGTLGEEVGWHWGFGAAGVGMLISLAIYVAGQKYLPADHLTPRGKARAGEHRPAMQRRDWIAFAALMALIPTISMAVVPNNQIFNAYLVWGDARFDLVFFGWRIPTSYLVSIDAVVSVSFLALVALFYRWYGRRWKEPDEITKMVIGSVFSILGMFCLMLAAQTPADEKIGLFWPMMFELMNSIAFAHILPVSLALFSRMAPPAIQAAVIGLYYLSLFGANKLVGWIGGYYETMETTRFWLLHAGFALVAGVIFLLFKLLVVRWMGEPAPKDATPAH